MTEPTLHLAIAIVVGGLIAGLRRYAPSIFAVIPRKAQAYPAAALGALLSLAVGALTEGGTVDSSTLKGLAHVGLDVLVGVFDGLTAVGGHHALKRMLPQRESTADPSQRTRITILLVLLAFAVGCTPAQRAGIPVISQIDAVGVKAAQLLGWCEQHSDDALGLKRAAEALRAEDYVTAIEETSRLVEALRAAGKPIPSEVEVGLRLAQGTLEGLKAAQAIEDATRALSSE